MPKITYRDLFSLVKREIAKDTDYLKTPRYKDQTSKDGIALTSRETFVDVSVAELVQAVQNILNEALPATILSGLEVTATTPISAKVKIASGKGTVGGKFYELEDDIQITIPFDSTTEVFYLSLYNDRIVVENTYHSDKLTIAKIVVPYPGDTSLVQDTKDNSWNAYIVNFHEYKLYGLNDVLEEDTIELLRDNIGDILADNLIGNIKLSEDLKIINTQGTLELNSDSLKLYDSSANLLSKFNRNGVYFYDTNGVELARFTGTEARVGNIRVLSNSIQSSNFISGSTGFRIRDNGSVEFSDATIRGTLYATLGTIGGFTITATKLYGGIIQTSLTVGAGSNGVIMDTDGLRGYDAILGLVFNLPTDGSAPSFSSGTINNTVFEINTNAVLRTSSTVGDGSASSAGILINNTGLYGCEANQLLLDANLKALINGTVSLKGTITATAGTIGNVTITATKLSGGTIEGTLLRTALFETSDTAPRIRIDTLGLYYQETTSTGKYGVSGSGGYGFKYGDGTKYGAGVLAYLFNTNFPPLTIAREQNKADMRLYNRSADPTTGTHQIGDLICVSGKLKICTTAGTPGTFTVVGSQS